MPYDGESLMIGQKVGPYEIREKLGQGGMGVVYRAHDGRLGRDVAIKFLSSPALAGQSAAERFQQEARALARLNHPNIGVIHDLGVHLGTNYIVMEFVPGSSLAVLIARGPFPEQEVRALGEQIASALQQAHEQGLIHRDLKPSNVMVTPKGQAKILDFGLAKLMPTAETEATVGITAPMTVVGTMVYMAPEQLRGEALDARSDIYSLGAVLYEMATGQRTFQGKTGVMLSDAVLHKPVAHPRGLRPEISPALDATILKCLQKAPADRYQSAAEVADDLKPSSATAAASRTTVGQPVVPARRRWPIWSAAAIVALLAGALAFNVFGLRDRVMGKAPDSPIRSLAVLPLTNLSHDPEQELFADGMTEAVISEMARIKALKVISRTTMMQYKGAKKSLREIARELGVDGVVEGAIQREGDDVRVTVQLVQSDTDTPMWSETYRREMRGILSLQSEVARAIAAAIRIAVTPEEQNRFALRESVNPQAHELILKGRALLAQSFTERPAIERAAGFFREASQIDPQSAPAYASLADALSTLAGVGYRPMKEACPEFRESAARAVTLDPNYGPAYSSRAMVKYYCDWDWQGALDDARHAVQLAPGEAGPHNTLGFVASALGFHDEAIEHDRIAVELDPLNLTIGVYQAISLGHARRFPESIAKLRKVLEFSPESLFAKFELGRALTATGKYEEGAAVLLSRKVPTANTNWMLAHAYGRMGKKKEAQQILDLLLEKRKKQFIWPCLFAIIYAGMGEKDKAFEWLEKTYQEREYWLQTMQVQPMFDPLRDDPRFAALVRRMNFPK